jgi:glycosyltransferase involved in cell wall biosynthesis
MPAHNEASMVAASVDVVANGLRARGEEFEILVVENGSSDATALIAADLADHDPSVLVRSLAVADYGAAILEGIVCARGDVVVLFDVDYYDLDFLDRAVKRLRAAAPEASPTAIVVGSKRAPGTVDSRPWHRRFVTATFAAVLRVGFGLSVSDTHGMKVMRRTDVEPVARRCRTRADVFDTELVLRVESAGLGVAELPVTVRELRPSRTPIARRVLRSIVGLVRLRLILYSESRSS